MIRELLVGKSAEEKAQIKGREIAKFNHKGKFLRDELEIEITDLKEIEGGIEVMARAWKGAKQLGFGKDGSVDIERFRIFNPPILVDDPNGNIVYEDVSPITGISKERRLKEDPQQAIKNVLAHTISIVGKEDTIVVKGKIGNTTSTFFSSLDGQVQNEGAVWATVHGAATGNGSAYTGTSMQCAVLKVSASDWRVFRCPVLFDTSALPDGDAISSATLSLWAFALDGNSGANADSTAMSLVASTPASDSAIVDADYDQFGTTKFATDVNFSAITLGQYFSWTLNGTGIAAISKIGISKFGARVAIDVSATEPTGFNIQNMRTVEQSGTDNDPKLVVEHAEAGTNIQINIGDTWKEVPAIKINIGDVWKDVVSVKQNIGDTWKDVF